jgi:hypothetical protein
MPLLPLANVILDSEHTVSPNQDIPKDEMDIFYRGEQEFLPEGRTWESLTDKERTDLKAKYRFDPLRPGMYQAVTAVGRMGANI